MTVEDQLVALREAFLAEIDSLWQDVPDLASLDHPRAKGIAAHHLDYTEQHKAMFLNEIAALGVLFRHLHEEEAGHARKSARVHAELTGAPVPPEDDFPPPTSSRPATPAAPQAPAPAPRSVRLTVGSLKGQAQPQGEAEE